ncbi:MAG: ATP-dependent helicase [Lachnospiraceae bacterium]|nr:ATP-dependent helicase [Lachnospiraceae bacterium]
MPDFNKGQLEAIHHINGPMLALAGPGSGKTTAIVHRIKYLIDEIHVNPSNILVITFTRASAREMQERFFGLMKGSKCPVTFGTFHSVFFYILKVAYGYDSGSIFSEDDKYKLIRELIKKKELEYDDEEEAVADLVKEISLMKGDMIPVEHFYSSVIGEEVFREIYRDYQNTVVKRGKLDFDDMMVYCYELLSERPDILSSLQKRYQYILVDEFQDINKLQYEITKMLAAPDNNLFIVGDDDQSIYGFRGAKPEIMLNFRKDYPDVKITLLDTNYRCNRNIVEGAEKLISHNMARYEKKLISSMDYEEPIYIHHMKNRNDENTHIIETVRRYFEEGVPYSEMSVIYRINAQAGSLVHRLMEYNIPFYTRDRVPCIYDHFAVKNIFDYIRAASGNRERGLFLRIINRPNRYISREMLMESEFSFDALIKRYEADKKDWAVDKLMQLKYDLETLSRLKPYAAVNFIRKAIGYDQYIKEYCEYRHLNEEDIYEVLDEVAELSRQYSSYDEWFNGIDEYRSELEEHSRLEKKENREGVAVTTMHSAKGLEYDVVLIPEANEGLAPYKKAVLPEEIEEERRMFYVAMTRARHHLHIYEVKEYYNKELEASRFLGEILDE